MRWMMATVVLVSLLAAPGLATWSENFDSYANGGLDPVSGGVWVGSAGPTTGVIDVVSDVFRSPEKSCRITEGTPYMSASATVNQTMVNNQLTLIWYVRGDAGTTKIGWYLRAEATPTDGTGVGDWYGGAANATPRIDGLSGVDHVGTSTALTPGLWYELKSVINFSTGYTQYYCNGTAVGNLRWGDENPGRTGIDHLIIERYNRSDAPPGHLWVDDISITPEPTALILLGLGGLLGLRRRR